jgi:hypothetical protein
MITLSNQKSRPLPLPWLPISWFRLYCSRVRLLDTPARLTSQRRFGMQSANCLIKERVFPIGSLQGPVEQRGLGRHSQAKDRGHSQSHRHASFGARPIKLGSGPYGTHFGVKRGQLQEAGCKDLLGIDAHHKGPSVVALVLAVHEPHRGGLQQDKVPRAVRRGRVPARRW